MCTGASLCIIMWVNCNKFFSCNLIHKRRSQKIDPFFLVWKMSILSHASLFSVRVHPNFQKILSILQQKVWTSAFEEPPCPQNVHNRHPSPRVRDTPLPPWVRTSLLLSASTQQGINHTVHAIIKVMTWFCFLFINVFFLGGGGGGGKKFLLSITLDLSLIYFGIMAENLKLHE